MPPTRAECGSNPASGRKMTRIVIERRTSHRPQQHRRRSQARLNRVGGQWIVRHRQRCSANQFALKLKLMAKALRHGLQDENGLISDFRTNAITGESRKFQKHGKDSTIGKFGDLVNMKT